MVGTQNDIGLEARLNIIIYAILRCWPFIASNVHLLQILISNAFVATESNFVGLILQVQCLLYNTIQQIVL